MEAKKRRLENNLVTLGTGIIAFGLWAFIKLLLTVFFLGNAYFKDTAEEDRLAALIVTLVVAVLMLLMYVWLGLSARAEGKGKKKNPFYLIVVGLISLFNIVTIPLSILYLLTEFNEIEDPLTVFVTIIIDVTTMIFLIQLIYSSVLLRKIRKNEIKEAAA